MNSSSIRHAIAAAVVCLLAACGGGLDDRVEAAHAVVPSAKVRPPLGDTASSVYGGVVPEQAAEQLLNTAQERYASTLLTHEATRASGRFLYRFYPGPGIYVGLAVRVQAGDGLQEGGVYVMGGPFGTQPVYVGPLMSFITPVLPTTFVAKGKVSAVHPGGGLHEFPQGVAMGDPVTLTYTFEVDGSLTAMSFQAGSNPPVTLNPSPLSFFHAAIHVTPADPVFGGSYDVSAFDPSCAGCLSRVIGLHLAGAPTSYFTTNAVPLAPPDLSVFSNDVFNREMFYSVQVEAQPGGGYSAQISATVESLDRQ